MNAAMHTGQKRQFEECTNEVGIAGKWKGKKPCHTQKSLLCTKTTKILERHVQTSKINIGKDMKIGNTKSAMARNILIKNKNIACVN